MYNFIKKISEGKSLKELEQATLPYARDGLGRSLSKQALDYHFGKLYKSYVDFLHNIYFTQFKSPKGSNTPTGVSEEFIDQHFKSFDKFKEEFEKTAMGIQGSGWVYLARDGKIKTIVNHQIKQDIVLLIDWWEHAWALDYQADKKKYLDNQWKIINWDIINAKL